MMSSRADAHMHLFSPGYVDRLPASCRRAAPDELTLYEALAQRSRITQALVIGYEGEPAYLGNNEYLARVAQAHPWLRPTAYVARPEELSVQWLQTWEKRKFVGLSMYLFDEAVQRSLQQVPADCWNWIVSRRWLVSVNSRGGYWNAWASVLERFPELRLLASHLGLPEPQGRPPAMPMARDLMQPLLGLARFPAVHVKLSAFYALAQPSHAWPHSAAWPYAQCALAQFGERRLLWGSDFSPSLEHVSFDQACTVLEHMTFLSDEQRNRIAGANLMELLNDVESAKS